MGSGGSRRKLAIHGPVVELDCSVPSLEESLDALLGEFAVAGWPQAFVPTTGVIHPYEEAEVLSRLPASARHIIRTSDSIDIYEEGDRYWLVDDRWGMSEIDLARGHWRSWIVPAPAIDPYRVAELSTLWPLAQLLSARGLHMMPAISAVRDGFAVLLICPFGVEPELKAMIAGGYKVIGQRWTALREEDGRLALLHLPGKVERLATPRLRYSTDEQESWIDVTREYPGSWQNHAFCDAVLVAEPARRASANLRETESPGNAVNLLRDAWPTVELQPAHRLSPIPEALIRSCRCFEVRLSRNTKEFLSLLNSMRYANPFSAEQSAAA